MIGEEVRRRREELGLTGVQLAARAGMAPSAVSQIETGKRIPSSTSVLKLANALGIDVGDLYPKGQLPLPDPELVELAEWAATATEEELVSAQTDLITEIREFDREHGTAGIRRIGDHEALKRHLEETGNDPEVRGVRRERGRLERRFITLSRELTARVCVTA